MIESTYYSKGNNDFKDCVFSAQEWSAPSMVSPTEIKDLVGSLKLEGRVIKQVKIIGLAYNLTREWIEERAYNINDAFPEEIRQDKSDYFNIEPSTPYLRYAEIDEPLLIEFEDGDVFEIDTPQQPEFRMSMNCIPWWIDAGTNPPNVDANTLFSSCLGRTIKSVEIKTYETDEDPMFFTHFDENGTKKELVSAFILRFDDDSGLCIEGWIDFCHVSYIDNTNNVGTITFGELRPALFNWEDIHIDSLTEYEASSNAFHFGPLGKNHTREPYITLVPENKDTSLHISVPDFLLFDWSITHYKKEIFDEYGDYEFTKTEWGAVLEEAEKLVSFATFDDLFEYVTQIEIFGYKITGGKYNVTLSNINHCGVEFWKNITKYRMQLQDMKAWSDLVLSDSDKMSVSGF